MNRSNGIAKAQPEAEKARLILETMAKVEHRIRPLFKNAGYDTMRIRYANTKDQNASTERFIFEFTTTRSKMPEPQWVERITLTLSAKNNRQVAELRVRESVDERIRSAAVSHHFDEETYQIDHLGDFKGTDGNPVGGLADLLDTIRNTAELGIKSGDGNVPAWIRRCIYSVGALADIVNDTLRYGITPIKDLKRSD